MQIEALCYKGKFYEKVAVCLFIGTKMKVTLCSYDLIKQNDTRVKEEKGRFI